jgi:hypothetical protein
MGVPAEDAQRQARALELGELAEPHHRLRQAERPGRLGDELLTAPVHMASQGAPGIYD